MKSRGINLLKNRAVAELILTELERAQSKFEAFHSWHEGYAVLLEEVDELWFEVKKYSHANASDEAIQIAAMAIRMIVDLNPGWVKT